MSESRGKSRLPLALGATFAALLATMAVAPASDNGSADPDALRVCSDPNNLPFSNAAGEGFENRLAALVADDLGQHVTYAWHAQRRGFVRETLKAKLCDVIIGVPDHYDLVETTQPYYRSTYVFVSQADRKFNISSIKDPRLKHLSIAVHLIGDDGSNTPPVHALGEQGIIDNVIGYPIYGDYRDPNPTAKPIEAVERGEADIAAVWGPLAGYFAKASPTPLIVTPITGVETFKPLRFDFALSMGVRKGDHGLRDKLNAILSRRKNDIGALLKDFGVPLVTPASSAQPDSGAVDEK